MSLASTLDVSVRSMLQHSQILRFLRECRTLEHLMFQWGQCFNRDKDWGSSGNVACLHTWCFSMVNALTQSRFTVPQGMSLASTLDVSARSMFWHSQGLRFLRECRSPAHFIFQLGQCFDTFKVWGSSRNVVRRHTWCFSEVNTSTHSSLEVSQGMSPAGTLEVSVRSMLRHS